MRLIHIKRILLILYLSASDKIHYVNSSATNDHFDTIFKNDILNKVRPYQVTLILQEHKNATVDNNYVNIIISVFKLIISQKSIIVLDISKLDDYEKFLCPHESLVSLRTTTLFISLLTIHHKSKNLTELLMLELKRNLKFYISLSPSTIRPYCLVLIIVKKRIPIESINVMLLYAWKKKFLDFTVLQSVYEDDPCQNKLILHFYNPFFDDFSLNCYTTESIIFPNKLRNMNKYQLKVALITRPPSVNFVRNIAGEPININGSDYGGTTIVSEAMNYSIKWVSPDITGYAQAVSENTSLTLLDLIAQGEIDYSGNCVFLHLALKDHNLRHGETSMVVWFDELVPLVPIIPSPKLSMKLNAFYIMLSVIAHVSIIRLFTKLCKFNPRFWIPHRILQILVGNPLPNLPTRIPERAIFMFLFILSQRYSSKLYAQLTGIHLNELDDGPYNTITDLERPDIILEILDAHINMTFHKANEIVQRLGKKVQPVSDAYDCPSRLLKHMNVSCIIDKSVAWNAMQSSNRNGSRKIKIMDYVFWSAPKGNMFSEASPYVEEYFKITQYVCECGLWYRWLIKDKVRYKSLLFFETDSSNSTDHLLRSKLILIWSSGCLVSLIAFVSELIVYRLLKDMYL